MNRYRRGQIPLWFAVTLAAVVVVALCIWTMRQTSDKADDGREMIVFWGNTSLGEEVETIIHQFEQEHPKYKVVMSKAVARDMTGDAQRLMSAIAGGVPPDVVFFDRFAIGEWASRGALMDLRPMLDAQMRDDPDRIDLSKYYEYTVKEASYRPAGTTIEPGIYGVPCSTDIRMMWVNNDCLRQAGLVDAQGKPRPPKNWDELREYANKLTIFRTPGDKRSGIARLGFAPNSGNSWLYMYAWQAGGEMMNADRTRVTMDGPAVVRALHYMTDTYDDLGGVGQVMSFEQAQQGGALDPFLLGRLAIKIDGDWILSTIADWKPDMDFTVAPAPMPQDQLDAGRPPVAWSGGFAFVIPTTSRQKEGAWEFIRYMRRWQTVKQLEDGRREQREAEGRLYLPKLEVNREFFDRLRKESIENNPKISPRFRDAYKTIAQLMPNTFIRPVTPVGQLLWTQHVRAYDAAVRHEYADEAKRKAVDEVKLALSDMQTDVQSQLDSLLRPPPPSVVSWRPYFWMYAVFVIAPFIAMFAAYKRRRREYGYRPREVAASLLFVSPWVIGFVVLVGGPILFSIVFSFTRYDVLSPARYVGLSNYIDVVGDRVFYKSLLNTAYMVIAIPLGMAVSLAIALLLNRAVRGIGFYRAAFYMPAIIPLVAASLMWIWIFNPSYGLINTVLAWVLDTGLFHAIERGISHFTSDPFHFTLPLWLQDPGWSKPSLILMKLWAAGGGMIVWLAGLQSIPQELYEAAKVDGANPWQRFRNVTIPMLSPYILFNLIIGLIGTMQMWTESYIMTEGGPADSTLFYGYYLFKGAFQYFRMGYASSMAWILFVIVLLLTLMQLWLSKKWVHYEQG